MIWTSLLLGLRRSCTGGVINKERLVDLLRKHPNWNEDAFAVVFDITVNRDINGVDVLSDRDEVCILGQEIGLSQERYTELDRALRVVTRPASKLIPSEECAELVKAACQVQCKAGQKVSRVVNKICTEYGLDKHPEYNARFAKLADSLNPLSVAKKAVLSVHPCDYLEMSNMSNSWNSCHCLEDGSYCAGTLSYMLDACSLIFYTIEDDWEEQVYKAPKTTREVFCYEGGVLLQSRLYPRTYDEETKTVYRNIVQQAIARCLDVPNLWALRKGIEAIDRFVDTHSDALHYPDYSYEEYNANISLLNSVYQEAGPLLIVGATVPCICCSDDLVDTDSLTCSSCGNRITCADCGRQISGDDICDLDEEYYCYNCISYCEECDSYTRSPLTTVHRTVSQDVSVCPECLEDYTCVCDECGETYMDSFITEVAGSYYCATCLAARKESAATSA